MVLLHCFGRFMSTFYRNIGHGRQFRKDLDRESREVFLIDSGMEVWKHSQNNPIFFSGKVSIPTFKVKTSLPRSSICNCVFSFTHLHYKPVCTLKFIASLQGKGRLTFMTVKQWYQINGAAPENSMWFTPPEQQGRV